MSTIADFLRQIHPVHIQGQAISSDAFSLVSEALDKQAFLPTSKDEGYLSTYDANTFSAERSFEHYTALELKSAGVLGISKGECDEGQLPYIYDNRPFEGHCSIDFNGKTKTERKTLAILLRDYAVARGWLYHPE